MPIDSILVSAAVFSVFVVLRCVDLGRFPVGVTAAATGQPQPKTSQLLITPMRDDGPLALGTDRFGSDIPHQA